MALTPCPDCGREVSTLAAACPQCGRPMAALAPPAARQCPRCGCHEIARSSGLHSADEIIIFIVLLSAGILPGIVYYIYLGSLPRCLGCGQWV